MEATCMPKAQRLSLDIITTLPQPIIETILCLLPIGDAARTSILSREWRYKWTKTPKLVFFESKEKEEKYWSTQKQTSSIELARGCKDKRCKFFYVIHQVLLQRQGPIHEFTLSMDNVDSTCSEIDQIMLHLSRNHTLKKLKLELDEPGFGCTTYGLPLSVFSLNHLTDLHLEYCDVSLKPIFNGFGSLTSLTLKDISVCREALLHLLSNCPSLKNLCVSSYLYILFHGLLNLSEYFKLTQLMLEVNEADFYANPSITEIFKCLPVIENLTTWGYINSLLVECVPEETNHLKYFCLEEMGFIGDYGFTFFSVITKCSPNLEKIKIQIDPFDCYDLDFDPLEDYSGVFKSISDVWLEHLKELEFVYFRCYELEVAFVEFILARSPNLQKLVINRFWISDMAEEMETLITLFDAPRPPRASALEIVLKNRSSVEVFRGFDV